MAKKICIYLLAVLFIGSVAGVQATPRKGNIKPKKVHKWGDSKFEKFNSKSFHKYDLKKKSSASFLKKIKKFDSKIFKRKNKKGYNFFIAALVLIVSSFNVKINKKVGFMTVFFRIYYPQELYLRSSN